MRCGRRALTVPGRPEREVELFDTQGTLAAKLSDAERMTAVASLAVHPTRNIIAASTARGASHYR